MVGTPGLVREGGPFRGDLREGLQAQKEEEGDEKPPSPHQPVPERGGVKHE